MLNAEIGSPRPSFYDELKRLHLLDNLRLCLDAGDLLSWSGQTTVTPVVCSDRSPSNLTFGMGAGFAGDTGAPVPKGIAGRRSAAEFFQVDGSHDAMTPYLIATPTWLQGFHQANAKFTIVEWSYTGTGVFGISGDSIRNSDGFAYVGFLHAVGIQVTNGGAGAAGIVYSKFHSRTVWPDNTFTFSATSVDITTGKVTLQSDNLVESYTGQSYTSPSAANAETAFFIFNAGNSASEDDIGAGKAIYAMWDVGLSADQLNAIYLRTKGRFGV